MAELRTSYLGLSLKNPLIVGSSGLTDSVENVIKLEKHEAAAVVLKSLFEEEIIREMETNLKKMASSQFIYPETLEFYEDQQPDEKLAHNYLELIDKVKKKVSIPVIASINCVTAKQWTYFPKRIEQAGADALELNIFILPTDLGRTGEQNENLYFEIIREVKKQVNIPVAVKISYYFSNLASMIKKLSETGVDGMVLFNKFYNPDFDLDDFVVTSTNVLSSPTDISNSLRWMAIMSQRVNCDLAASTGIHDGDGVIKQILAGANAVQIVSTIYKNGPEQIKKILAQMNNWMNLKRFSSLNDFRGKMSQSKSKDPAAYERVQFMKYFRGYKPE